MKTKKFQIYKCEICGNIVEVLHEGASSLSCCGEPMTLMKEGISDEGKEKHVPVYKKDGDKVQVCVGSTPHPMESKHYIEWVQVIGENFSYFKFLKPSEKPEAEFCIPKGENIIVREYCNIHGLWRNHDQS